MRDLIVFGLVVLALPYAFQRPFFGLMMFSWLAYMRPQDLCWGFARSMRLSFFMGITMVVGWLAFESGHRPFYKKSWRVRLLFFLAFFVSISLFGAYEIDRQIWSYYVEFLKIMAIAMFTTAQVDNRQRLRAMLWTIALSLGFYGFKSGLLGLLGGGSVILRGPGGMLGDNNDFALAMVMNMPLLFYLGREEKNPMVRRFCDFCFLLSAVTVMLTHSRGGFLSMVIVCLLLAWRSGKLFIATILLAFGAIVFLNFAPSHVIERVSSIGEGTKDGSAMARWRSWTVALRIVGDNPFFGVGLRNFEHAYRDYGKDLLSLTGGKTHVAHNSYLQIWAEAGTFALLIYLTLLSSVFTATRWVRRRARRLPEFSWAFSYARAMEITTAGFMVGSFFLNRGHFDLIYHWIALTGCLLWIFQRELAAAREASGTGAASRAVARADPRSVRAEPDRPVASGLPTWSRT